LQAGSRAVGAVSRSAEQRARPAPEGYLDFLRIKPRQAVSTLPANLQKSTFSNDRYHLPAFV
jgi:hypothetical protein